MTISRGSSYNFGGKLVMAVLLSIVLGYLWFCWEAGRSPLAILKFFEGKEEASPPPRVAKTEPPKADPVAPKKTEPAKSEPIVVKKPEPVAAPAGPKIYSAIEMGLLFNELDEHLRRGRLFEAREKLHNTSRLMVPGESVVRFAEYDSRVGKYHSLVLETTKGGTIDKMPQMTRILIKDGGKLIVKVLAQDRDSVTYETLTGIRSKIDKDRCEKIEPLTEVYAKVEVNEELKKQAGYKGLQIDLEIGKPMVISEKPGRTVTALQIFELADFCARNGANDKLVPLFEEAMKRDADLLTAVHEYKADRMIEVLFYFVGIKSASDVAKTSDILRDRYSDTKAYRDRVASDAEARQLIEFVLKKPVAAIAKGPDRPPKATPAPVSPSNPPPTPGPTPTPVEPPPADPPTAPVVERITEPERPVEPTSVGMPFETPSKVAELVARGDKFFIEAKLHLNLSNPNTNPTGWTDENKKALDYFMKSNRDCYTPAQDMYGSAPIPHALLDRVREASMCTALCRKRSVSSRR